MWAEAQQPTAFNACQELQESSALPLRPRSRAQTGMICRRALPLQPSPEFTREASRPLSARPAADFDEVEQLPPPSISCRRSGGSPGDATEFRRFPELRAGARFQPEGPRLSPVVAARLAMFQRQCLKFTATQILPCLKRRLRATFELLASLIRRLTVDITPRQSPPARCQRGCSRGSCHISFDVSPPISRLRRATRIASPAMPARVISPRCKWLFRAGDESRNGFRFLKKLTELEICLDDHGQKRPPRQGMTGLAS